jgi:menaquinone-dependent protoporphyrinogen oxidase
MTNVLVLYGTFEGHTRTIAEHMAATIRSHGRLAITVNGSALPSEFSLADFNAAIIGASVHMGQHVEAIVRFVKANRAWLNQTPSAFFSVSLMQGGLFRHHHLQADAYIHSFLVETGWRPHLVRAVGGALPFTRYGFAQRFITSALVRRTLGQLDTSRDAVYTNWAEVDDFTMAFLATLD